MSWIYARRVEGGDFLPSTAVCANHYYLSPESSARCSSPIPAQHVGAGPLSCAFCERAK